MDDWYDVSIFTASGPDSCLTRVFVRSGGHFFCLGIWGEGGRIPTTLGSPCLEKPAGFSLG